MFKEKLLRKMLSSLPRCFNMRVTTIEETQGILSMKVNELIECLLTFELSFKEK